MYIQTSCKGLIGSQWFWQTFPAVYIYPEIRPDSGWPGSGPQISLGFPAPPNPTHVSLRTRKLNFGNMVFKQGKKLGVIRLDKWGDVLTTGTGHSGYVPLPGDVDSVDSYDYPLVASIVKDVTWELLTNPEGMSGVKKQKEIVNNVTAAVEELIEQQVGAIVANCGLFMWLHALGIIDVAVDRAMANLTK